MDVTEQQVRKKSREFDLREEKKQGIRIKSREDARKMVVFSEILKPRFDDIF